MNNGDFGSMKKKIEKNGVVSFNFEGKWFKWIKNSLTHSLSPPLQSTSLSLSLSLSRVCARALNFDTKFNFATCLFHFHAQIHLVKLSYLYLLISLIISYIHAYSHWPTLKYPNSFINILHCYHPYSAISNSSLNFLYN